MVRAYRADDKDIKLKNKGFSPENSHESLRLFSCGRTDINLLKPTGYVMHHQFNIQELYVLPTLYVFCIYLRTKSDFCPVQNKLIGFYNRDEKCLLRCTNWAFK